MRLNNAVISALVKRDTLRYFSNPSGYVFLTLFIFLSAAAAFWQPTFFLYNLANLDQLNALFPLILVFFIPSLTMPVWAEEKRSGTEELLLSLPATKLDIVVGKYLAVLGIYTASVILSMSHIVILFWLGTPDVGLMVGNYLAYWLMGAALIPVGMAASQMTRNNTIAFILGVLITSVIVFLPTLTTPLGDLISEGVEKLSTGNSFETVTKGIISFGSLSYFLSLAFIGMYINAILLSKYKWQVKQSGWTLIRHLIVRLFSLLIALIAINIVINNYLDLRVDVTAEKLHSLSSETKKFLKELPDDRPVTIRAYFSKNVPAEFVQVRSNLVGFLGEIDAVAGPKVTVKITDTKEFTDQSREAAEQFGIVPMRVRSASGTDGEQVLFLGLAISCGTEEQVIPFFDRGLPVEYELIRSIKVVTNEKRRTIGVIGTELDLNGNVDFGTRQQTPEWQVIKELKKQYRVVDITAKQPINVDVDAVFAALPSTMVQRELDNLKQFIKIGTPTLLMVDPLPTVDPSLAPAVDPNENTNPFIQQPQAPKPVKGEIEDFLKELGVTWSKAGVIWDSYNPHPALNLQTPEIIFVGDQQGGGTGFNQEHPLSRGLQEVVFLFPGALDAVEDSSYIFTPLISSSVKSGKNNYHSYFSNSFFGRQLNPRAAPHFETEESYTLMAHITGNRAPEETDSNYVAPKVNMIVAADVDFVSEQFFNLRRQGIEGLNFDNVSLFLNAMDYLVGDTTLLSLRKKRAKHRTLSRVESMKERYIHEQEQEKIAAEAEAQQALADANSRLKSQVDAVRSREDLDEQTRDIMVRNAQETETRRFEAQKNRIEAEKQTRIRLSEEKMAAGIRLVQDRIKLLAVVLPPIPVFLFGIYIFLNRRKREREGAIAARRVKE